MVPRGLGLLTDLYELTMLGGYVRLGMADREAVFDLFFRSLPFGGGFAIAAGLEDAVRYLTELRFSGDDLRYLEGLGLFDERVLAYLADLRFTGDLDAIPEGTPVFPPEPLLRVRAPLAQAQLVESALLATVNYQTLVATKAARVALAAGDAPVLEFGLRRAQGIDGAFSGSRAAMIGGCAATSNVLAGRRFGVPVRGTQAHSWIMSFPDESSAFRGYARVYPDTCLLLVDTYDTLRSGLPEAIEVARELEASGHRFAGIRLDSGDLAALSREARRRLDEAGLAHARIVASGDLDEHRIAALRAAGARIDIYGVGTRLITCWDEPALPGVYKLVALADPDGRLRPRLKRSDSPEKATLPGVKTVLRLRDAAGRARTDAIVLQEAEGGSVPRDLRTLDDGAPIPTDGIDPAASGSILEPIVRKGEVVATFPPVLKLRDRTRALLAALPEGPKRLRDPAPYPVGIGPGLDALRRSAAALRP